MSGNPRELITMVERGFPVCIRIGVPRRSRPAVFSYHRLARRELQLGWLGDDAIGIARGVERRRFDLLRRRYVRQRVRRPMARRVKDQDRRGGVFQVREAEAGAADRGRAPSDAMTAGKMQSTRDHLRLITEPPRYEPEGSGRKRRRVG